MHKYLKSIGFSQIESHRMLEEILQDVENQFDKKKIVEKDDHRIFAELSKDYGYDAGIAVCGEYDQDGVFHREYYYPYYRGQGGFPCSDLTVERHADKESFAGAYDDYSIGVTLIFYLINPVEYIRQMQSVIPGLFHQNLAFSALADRGRILLPIKKNRKEEERSHKVQEKRNSLIAAAQKGDQEAIENLTLEDIDLYSTLSKRIQKEDLYSIVNTTFIPSGIECDQYAVIGEILEVNITRNSRTEERLYELRIVSNGIPMDVCINEKDLFGIPEPGRRFKGRIWLQGTVE